MCLRTGLGCTCQSLVWEPRGHLGAEGQIQAHGANGASQQPDHMAWDSPTTQHCFSDSSHEVQATWQEVGDLDRDLGLAGLGLLDLWAILEKGGDCRVRPWSSHFFSDLAVLESRSLKPKSALGNHPCPFSL